MEDQSSPIDFNKRAGAALQRIRKAAGWSQADLAAQLVRRDLPFTQQTVVKVEQGTRPLRFEEACAIADELGVDLDYLSRRIDDEVMAEAVAQIERSNLILSRWNEGMRSQLAKVIEIYESRERYLAVKREAEQRLRKAGAIQDGGSWRTADGEPLYVDNTVTTMEPLTPKESAMLKALMKESANGQR